MLLLTRAFLIAEALMSDLDPKLNVVAAFGDEVKRLTLARYAPERLASAARRLGRDVERLTGAIASAAFLIAGSLLVVAGGWHRPLGDALLVAGIVGSAAVALGAFRAH